MRIENLVSLIELKEEGSDSLEENNFLELIDIIGAEFTQYFERLKIRDLSLDMRLELRKHAYATFENKQYFPVFLLDPEKGEQCPFYFKPSVGFKNSAQLKTWDRSLSRRYIHDPGMW